MTAPAPPASMEVPITPAAGGEGPALTALAIRSKAHWGYPESWMAEWRPLLTITEGLIASGSVFVARSLPGTPPGPPADPLAPTSPLDPVDRALAGPPPSVGFYALEVTGTTASLEHLWVDPSAMRRGVGRALFEDARERAARLGCRVLQIDSDPSAEPFYRAMGAVRVGTVSAPVAGTRRELPRLRLQLGAAVDGG